MVYVEPTVPTIPRPENVATPVTAATLGVPTRDALPLTVAYTVAVAAGAVVSVVPSAFCSVITGCVVNAAPDVTLTAAAGVVTVR
jgi:hypothetical protein